MLLGESVDLARKATYYNQNGLAAILNHFKFSSSPFFKNRENSSLQFDRQHRIHFVTQNGFI